MSWAHAGVFKSTVWRCGEYVGSRFLVRRMLWLRLLCPQLRLLKSNGSPLPCANGPLLQLLLAKKVCVTGGVGHKVVKLKVVASYLWPAFKVLPAPCVILPTSRSMDTQSLVIWGLNILRHQDGLEVSCFWDRGTELDKWWPRLCTAFFLVDCLQEQMVAYEQPGLQDELGHDAKRGSSSTVAYSISVPSHPILTLHLY